MRSATISPSTPDESAELRLHEPALRAARWPFPLQLWLVLWSAVWWRGVLGAGGGELARRALDR